MSNKPKWIENAIPSYEWKTREDYKPENREAIHIATQKKLTELDLNDLSAQRPDKTKIIDIIISINKTK